MNVNSAPSQMLVSCPRRLGDIDGRKARLRRRRGIFLGAATIALLVFIGAVGMRLAQPLRPVEGANVDQAGNLSFDRPRFFGRSETGVQIEITADAANRAGTNIGAPISLVQPLVTGSDGTKATADTGFWEEVAQRLILRGNIGFSLPDGQSIKADEARWEPNVGPDGKPTGSANLILSGHIQMHQPLAAGSGPDTALAQQAIWDSTAGKVTLYGATTFRAQSGDRVSAPEAEWDRNGGQLAMRGGVEFMRNGTQLARAQNLSWNQAGDMAQLSGNVTIHMAGMSASSDRASIWPSQQRIVGNGNVSISGPLGNGRAQSYEVNGRSGHVKLSGRARISARPGR